MDLSEYEKLVSDLDFDLLDDWEQGFLESVEFQIQRGRILTKTQIGKLRQICEKSGDRCVKSSLWPDWGGE